MKRHPRGAVPRTAPDNLPRPARCHPRGGRALPRRRRRLRRTHYPVADIRAAEEPRLAEVPDGALEATGLRGGGRRRYPDCSHAARGRVVGSRVVLLVGSREQRRRHPVGRLRLARRGARWSRYSPRPPPTPRGWLPSAPRAATSSPARPRRLPGRRPGTRRRRPGGGRLGGAGAARDSGNRRPPWSRRSRPGYGAGGGPAQRGAPGHAERPRRHTSGQTHSTVTFRLTNKPCLLLAPPPRGPPAGWNWSTSGLDRYLPPSRRSAGSTRQPVAARWPWPAPADDKYRRGVVGVVAGSLTYPGAAVLACAGAVRAGRRMVRYLGPAAVAAQVPGPLAGGGRRRSGPGLRPGQRRLPDPDPAEEPPSGRDRIVAALAGGRPAWRTPGRWTSWPTCCTAGPG
jgi:hypothetical protein